MRTRLAIIALAFPTLFSCNKGKGALTSTPAARSERTGGTVAPKTTVATTEDKSTGAASGAVQSKSSTTQVVQAAADTNISGAQAEFPPGSIAIDTSVTIRPGAGIANDQVASQLGIDSPIAASGNPVAIASSVPMDTVTPFTISLPLPDASQSSLALAADPFANLVVLYHVKKASAGGADFTGLIGRDHIDTSGGFARFITNHFGTYQAILTAAPVKPKEIAAAPAFTTAPVTPGMVGTARYYFVSGPAALSFGDNAGQREDGFQGFAHSVSPAQVAVKGHSLTVEPASKPKTGDSQ